MVAVQRALVRANAAESCGARGLHSLYHRGRAYQCTCPKAFLRPDSRLAAGRRLGAVAALEGRAAARLQGLKAAALKAPAALLRLADTREEAAGAVSLQEVFISPVLHGRDRETSRSRGAPVTEAMHPKERMRASGGRGSEWWTQN